MIISEKDVLEALPTVVELLGTWDITTIRASIGMYLVCKYIHEHTDIRVLLTGEISDELFGYKYTDFAPSAAAFQEEAEKRIRELHMYDVLRADRCISVNSLEARVPFGDLKFVRYAMSIDPELKMNRPGVAAKSSMLPTTTYCPTRSYGGRRRPSPMRWGIPWSLTSRRWRKGRIRTMNSGKRRRNTITVRLSPRKACSTGSCSSAFIPGRRG